MNMKICTFVKKNIDDEFEIISKSLFVQKADMNDVVDLVIDRNIKTQPYGKAEIIRDFRDGSYLVKRIE